MDKLNYAFNWLEGGNNMYGQLQLVIEGTRGQESGVRVLSLIPES